MELLKDLELIDVRYEDKKAVMIFLDEERGEIREVNFNKQSYDGNKKKFIDDPEKAAKVDEWCAKYFETTFEGLISKVGVKKDIYVYETFCSLWECETIDKFTEDDLGLIDNAEIADVICDNVGIKIRLNYDGKVYESKMGYSVWVESRSMFMVNPQKRESQLKAFEEKFGVKVEEKDKLIGTPVMFEVKKAMGKYIYIEIKKNKKK